MSRKRKYEEEDDIPAYVYLKPEEFYDSSLPKLFNSTSRRIKDKNSTFTNYANQIVRCQEYPNGIYIDHLGKIQENHPKSGIYILKRSGQKQRRTEETSDEEEETTSDDEETEEEITDEEETEEEEDDEEYSPTDDDEEEDDDSETEEEEEDETKEEISDEELDTNERIQLYLEKLKEDAKQVSRDIDLIKKKEQEYLKRKKYIDLIEKCDEDWKEMRSEKYQSCTKNNELVQQYIKKYNLSKLSNVFPKMTIDSNLFAEIPKLDLIIKNKKKTILSHFNFDTERFVCDGIEFEDLERLFEYVVSSYF